MEIKETSGIMVKVWIDQGKLHAFDFLVCLENCATSFELALNGSMSGSCPNLVREVREKLGNVNSKNHLPP